MKHFTIIILITCSMHVRSAAQSIVQPTAHKVVLVKSDAALQKIDIQFEAETEISNLLIIVSDKKGETVFLDNQYRFKGEYKRSIDMKEYGKGEFSLKVIRDENSFNQQIIFP
jgi:hypothetical protein